MKKNGRVLRFLFKSEIRDWLAGVLVIWWKVKVDKRREECRG